MRWSVVEKATGNNHSLPAVCSDNEVTNEPDNTKMAARPLKKAKYAWQVKGRGKNGLSSHCAMNKTHMCIDSCLKNDTSHSYEEMNAHDSHDDEFCGTSCHCLNEHVPASGSRSIPGPSSSYKPTEFHNEGADDGSFACSFYHPEIAGTSSQTSPISDAVTFETSSQNSSATQEIGSQMNYALRRWQSKQLAQGIIDNAINKVLGDLGIPSHQHDIINPNFNDPVNWGSYLNAQNIENEGVAEAIRQQGLQRKRYIQQPAVMHASVHNKYLIGNFGAQAGQCHSSAAKNVGDGENLAAVTKPADVVDSISDSFNAEKKSSNNCESAPFSFKAGFLTQNNKYQTSAESSHLLNDVEHLLQPDDLLNTAVSCAISEKGLGVLNVNE